MDAVGLIRARIEQCEARGVEILCCPETILGGLADYSGSPRDIAVSLHADGLYRVLKNFPNSAVATIFGFTELSEDGKLYNAAVVFHRGAVIGVYRKFHPAMNRSVYTAGSTAPVFRVGARTFGIVICNDSNYPDPVAQLTASGATALLVPTNNGLPAERAHSEIAAKAREVDIALAVRYKLWVIRADVAGEAGGLTSYGSSEIVNPDGVVVQSARPMSEDLIITDASKLKSDC